MHITKLNISQLQVRNGSWMQKFKALQNRYAPFLLPENEKNYSAEAIEHGGQYFYRVGDITVEASQYEYEHVIGNPKLYYFSSALKLHYRIQKAKSLGIGYHWPNDPAAPIHIFELAE